MNLLAVCNLPQDAIIGLDGQTLLLKRDDFVGIRLPDDSIVHLLTIRSNLSAAFATGYFFTSSCQLPALRYNPRLEEMEPLDEQSQENLAQQTHFALHQVIPYDRIVSPTQQDQWRAQTSYWKSTSPLWKDRKIAWNTKILPGVYQESSNRFDGNSLYYPPIPLLQSPFRRRRRHAGTQAYLRKLSASERTQLAMGDDNMVSLLERILAEYYHQDWKNLVADLQLAYVSFLYLQCLASLEHWKDLLVFLSFQVDLSPELSMAVLQVLPAQISSMDEGFLEVGLVLVGVLFCAVLNAMIPPSHHALFLAHDDENSSRMSINREITLYCPPCKDS